MGKILNEELMEKIEKTERKPRGNTLGRLVGTKQSNLGGGGTHRANKKNRDFVTTFRINRSLYNDFSDINTVLRQTNADVINDFIERYVHDHRELLK